jgi:hypothetical protein
MVAAPAAPRRGRGGAWQAAALSLALLAPLGLASPPAVAGGLSVEPAVVPRPPPPPPLPPEAAACARALGGGACPAPCVRWVPSPGSQGTCVHPSLIDRAERAPASSPELSLVTASVAVTADGPFDASLLIGGGSSPAVTLPFGAGARRVALVAHNGLFSPPRALVSICINSTPCPDWDERCSSCARREVVVEAPPTGGSPAADSSPPRLSLAAPFAPLPSWTVESLASVEARVLVVETGSAWSGSCSLRRGDGPPSPPLCLGGGEAPCTAQTPTGREGRAFALRLTEGLEGGWDAGMYELSCEATDAAGNTGSMAEPLELASAGRPRPSQAPGPAAGQSRCGDGRCEAAERARGCCEDCGCPPGSACVAGACAAATPGTRAGPAPLLALAALVLAALVGARRLRQGHTPRHDWASTRRPTPRT